MLTMSVLNSLNKEDICYCLCRSGGLYHGIVVRVYNINNSSYIELRYIIVEIGGKEHMMDSVVLSSDEIESCWKL